MSLVVARSSVFYLFKNVNWGFSPPKAAKFCFLRILSTYKKYLSKLAIPLHLTKHTRPLADYKTKDKK